MGKHLRTHRGRYSGPPTFSGPKPGDFPIGSLQSRAAARAIVAGYAEAQRQVEEAELANLSPLEKALIEDVESRLVRIWMIRLHRVGLERARVYEQPLHLGTPDELRHNRAIVAEIDRMTGGRGESIRGNSIEWNRLKVVAEENLRAQRK